MTEGELTSQDGPDGTLSPIIKTIHNVHDSSIGGSLKPDYSTVFSGTSMPLPNLTSRAAATRLGRP